MIVGRERDIENGVRKRWTVIGQRELVSIGREKERDRQKEREIEVVCLR